MNKLPVTLSLVAIGLLFAGGTSVAAGAPKKAATSYECFTDDGYGRKLPCTYGYKLVKSAQTNSYDCFTDDGYGRKLTCSYRIKRR